MLQLLEDTVVPKTPERASESPALSHTPCVVLLDAATSPTASASAEGDFMRSSILGGMCELAADRAAATAAAKAAAAGETAWAKAPVKSKTSRQAAGV